MYSSPVSHFAMKLRKFVSCNVTEILILFTAIDCFLLFWLNLENPKVELGIQGGEFFVSYQWYVGNSKQYVVG